VESEERALEMVLVVLQEPPVVPVLVPTAKNKKEW
jgi:hypothetical protein